MSTTVAQPRGGFPGRAIAMAIVGVTLAVGIGFVASNLGEEEAVGADSAATSQQAQEFLTSERLAVHEALTSAAPTLTPEEVWSIRGGEMAEHVANLSGYGGAAEAANAESYIGTTQAPSPIFEVEGEEEAPVNSRGHVEGLGR